MTALPHVVVRRVVAGAYGNPSFVAPYGMRIDAARVIEDADQNMGHVGAYIVAGCSMTQLHALECAAAVLRSDV